MARDGDEPKTPAERQQLCRRRKREGAIPIPAGSLEASATLSEALIEAGWLNAIDAENPVAVAGALAELHDWWLEHGTDRKPVTP